MITGLQGTKKNYKVQEKIDIKRKSSVKPMNNTMKKLLGWFGGNKAAPKNSSFSSSRNSQYSILPDGSETATRGQLVQVLLRDLVRKSGMPSGSVQCQIQVIKSRTRGQGIYVRLVVKHWDERLMKYAFAFQKALLTEIVLYEPKAATWLHGIAWQLEVANSCPFTELPGPSFWQESVASTQVAEPVDPFDIIPLPANAVVAAPKPVPAKLTEPVLPELSIAATLAAAPLLNAPEPLPSFSEELLNPPDETAQDLERLFAIRDNELANLAENNLLPAGYESTEPSPLQVR